MVRITLSGIIPMMLGRIIMGFKCGKSVDSDS